METSIYKDISIEYCSKIKKKKRNYLTILIPIQHTYIKKTTSVVWREMSNIRIFKIIRNKLLLYVAIKIKHA